MEGAKKVAARKKHSHMENEFGERIPPAPPPPSPGGELGDGRGYFPRGEGERHPGDLLRRRAGGQRDWTVRKGLW